MKKLIKKMNWDKGAGLLPAIIQDAGTAAVLMLGYMNKQSLSKTLKTKKVWFYSRSKKRLWMKGEVSKNTLALVDIQPDCDKDALLIRAKPAGPVCHTGEVSCFKNSESVGALINLFQVIEERKRKRPKKSYTSALLSAGQDRISLKVAEEALEVVQAAQKETKGRLIAETADLMYHLFVLLSSNNVSWKELQTEVDRRKK